MADIQNSDNNLYWVFTGYGKERLINFKNGDKLQLYSAAVGSYDWFTDPAGYAGGTDDLAFRTYHNAMNTTLGRRVGDYIAINSKAIDDANKVVTLSFTVPEELTGFDIREVGIFETDINGENHLFAICRMQPIPKPPVTTNHYISVTFNAKLYSKDLAAKYDVIELDAENNFATAEEVEKFQQSLLFVEANLAQQISHNTQLIGMNRPQQLYEQIESDKSKYSGFVVSTTYANFLNETSLENVQSFWVFDRTKDITRKLSIADLSYYSNYLATDKLVTQYERGYEGLAPWLDFCNGGYYTLDSDVEFDLLDRSGANPVDSKFTIFFVGAQNESDKPHTIIAKSINYNNQQIFKVQVMPDRSVELTTYTDTNNYTVYKTPAQIVPKAGKFYAMAISYDYFVNSTNTIIGSAKVSVNAISEECSVNKIGQYKGMQDKPVPISSFIMSANEQADPIDSKVSIIAVVKDKLSDDFIRATMYNMMALIGENPCLVH